MEGELKMTPLQHESYLMATLAKLKVQSGSPLDRLENDVLFNGLVITPTFFTMLFNLVKIQDQQLHQILKILTKSCRAMHQHNSLLVQQFFQSEDLFQLVVSINKIIEELWMLRKENPMQLEEWKTKH